MKKLIFASDHHFDHTNIIRFCKRPCKDVDEMNEMIITRHNEIANPQDDVFFLGDFSFSRNPNRIASHMKRMNGKITWILGNHDETDLVSRVIENMEGLNKLQRVITGFHYLYPDGGKKHLVALCHFPFETWHKSRHGSIHLHGHEHGNLGPCLNKRRLDVGIDTNNLYPYVWDDIKVRLEAIPLEPRT